MLAKIKILLLSDPNSVHTIKWAKSLAACGLDIVVFGLGDLVVENYNKINNIKIVTLSQVVTRNEGAFAKLKYLRALPAVKNIIKKFKPDIVHAHYATSYGLLGSLSGFFPFILSVWGGDVFSFPNKSFLHKFMLKYNLKKASKILSTSYAMAKETAFYTDKDIEVIPFGINMAQFRPMSVDSLFDANDIVIGTVKSLEKVYGIDYLIRAFKIVSDKHQALPLKLLIVGGGGLEEKLKQLAQDLDIEKKTIFTGKIPFEDVPKYHNMLSVFVAVSNSESFGVAVIEASACGKPVVVSNVGGLPEVVADGVTGVVVDARNPEKTAEAIEKLVLNKNLVSNMGKSGISMVKNKYSWDENVAQMMKVYKSLLNG